MFTPNTNDPFELFTEWYHKAKQNELNDPNAMSLATVGENAQPSVRIVLMKDYDKNGFVFYANLQSRKGNELALNHSTALVFHWKSLARQIRIEGTSAPVTHAEADEYFHSRARISQIGAWASQQSQPLSGRDELLDKVKAIETKFKGKVMPRPPHWSGSRVNPTRIEFWQDGEFRLHDRFIFDKIVTEESWKVTRLNP